MLIQLNYWFNVSIHKDIQKFPWLTFDLTAIDLTDNMKCDQMDCIILHWDLWLFIIINIIDMINNLINNIKILLIHK